MRGLRMHSERKSVAMLSDLPWYRINVRGKLGCLAEEALSRFPFQSVRYLSDDHPVAMQVADEGDPGLPRCLLWATSRSSEIADGHLTLPKGVDCPIVVLLSATDVFAENAKSTCAVTVVVPHDADALVNHLWSALRSDLASIPERQARYDFHRALATLSEREEEVLLQLIEGRCSKEIAFDLSIGRQTVLKHRSSLLKKLSIRNDVELALHVHRHREIALPKSISIDSRLNPHAARGGPG